MGGYNNINIKGTLAQWLEHHTDDFKGSYCEGHWFKSSMCPHQKKKKRLRNGGRI